MKRFVACLVIVAFTTRVTVAVASPTDEGLAAGNAGNQAVQGMVNQSSAQAAVPGYTSTPPQTALYGAPNLNAQGSAQLSACANAPNDPVCQAQTGAAASAATPRPALTPGETGIAATEQIQRDPGTALGNLSSYYASCITTPAPNGGTQVSNCNGNEFCLGNNCYSTVYQNDADFARTVSFMEAAREAGVYLDTQNMRVFSGETDRCRDRLLKNCCYTNGAGAGMSNQSMFGVGSRVVYDVLMNSSNREFIYEGAKALLMGSGFSGSFTTYGVTVAVNGTALPANSVMLYSGNNFAIAFDPWSLAITVAIYIVMQAMSCNREEGMLALKKGASLCREIGSYCTSCIRVLGKCVRCIEYTHSQCCFNSRLARMINEQGRVQVGRNWGDARNPDCMGFTIAELQRLDFAAMDLSEFYASIVPTLPNVSSLQANAAGRVGNCYYGQGRCQ